MANEKKPIVKPGELEVSNADQSTTTAVVDQIETPAELALKDQATARQIIARVVPLEGEVTRDEKELNRKKAFVGCWLLLSKKLAKSGNEDDKETKTDDKAKVSLFDHMLAEHKLSRATAYRRMSFARACIDNNVITTDMLALIEKSAVVTPELLTLLDACLSTPKGLKVQEDQGLLPGPDKPPVTKVRKPLQKQLAEKNAQVKALLGEIKSLLADRDLTKTITDKSVLDKLTTGYTQMDSSFLSFQNIEIPEFPKLSELPKLETIVKPLV